MQSALTAMGKTANNRCRSVTNEAFRKKNKKKKIFFMNEMSKLTFKITKEETIQNYTLESWYGTLRETEGSWMAENTILIEEEESFAANLKK